MRNVRAHLCLVLTAGSLLAACGSNDKTPFVEPNIPPTAFKQEILDTLRRTLDDPTNVHDAFLSDPVLTPVGSDQRYTSCVRYNPRDLNRTYLGNKERIAYFFGGHLNQLVEADKGQCAKAAYKPFPELEKLCFATKCN
ncbi:MAG TPA: hypothetical protein VGF02_10435 [Pseudolabrys sp.]